MFKKITTIIITATKTAIANATKLPVVVVVVLPVVLTTLRIANELITLSNYI